MTDLFSNLMAAIIYSGVGVAILMAAFVVVDAVTPGSLWQQTVVDKNQASATLMGSLAIAIAIVIAAAIW